MHRFDVTIIGAGAAGLFCAGIAGQHFQCEFAGTTLPGDHFRECEHALTNALTAVVRQNCHIMHIDQGPAGESREAFDAVDQPHGYGVVLARKGKHTEGLRAR